MQQQQLIPGLPDELGLHILARAPRSSHPLMKLVSKTWNSTMTSDHLFTLRRHLGVTEQWLYIHLVSQEQPSEYLWLSLDPRGTWRHLPPIPSSLSKSPRNMAELNGCLYVIDSPSVWRYDPRTNRWSRAAPMLPTPETDNKTETSCRVITGLLYAVKSRSAQVYCPVTDKWTLLASMEYRGMPDEWRVKPATRLLNMGMMVVAGRLWVRQGVRDMLDFVDAGGEVYDPATATWSGLPRGMLSETGYCSWQLATEVEGRLLLPERIRSLVTLKEYDAENGCWRLAVPEIIVAKVSLSVDCSRRGGFLMADWNGRLHVLVGGCVDGSMTVLKAKAARGEGGEFTVVASRRFDPVELQACQAVGI